MAELSLLPWRHFLNRSPLYPDDPGSGQVEEQQWQAQNWSAHTGSAQACTSTLYKHHTGARAHTHTPQTTGTHTPHTHTDHRHMLGCVYTHTPQTTGTCSGACTHTHTHTTDHRHMLHLCLESPLMKGRFPVLTDWAWTQNSHRQWWLSWNAACPHVQGLCKWALI